MTKKEFVWILIGGSIIFCFAVFEGRDKNQTEVTVKNEEDDRKPENIKIIGADDTSVKLQYTIGKYIEPSNLIINHNLCWGLLVFAKKTKFMNNSKTVKEIHIESVYEGGRFADSYGNPVVHNVLAFKAKWHIADAIKYQCDNYPDVMLHADIQNLTREFKNDIQVDCAKKDNYNKYYLCSKV